MQFFPIIHQANGNSPSASVAARPSGTITQMVQAVAAGRILVEPMLDATKHSPLHITDPSLLLPLSSRLLGLQGQGFSAGKTLVSSLLGLFVCRRQAERVTPWTMSMAPCGIHRLCLRGDSEVLHHRLPVAVTPSPDIAPAVPGRS